MPDDTVFVVSLDNDANNEDNKGNNTITTNTTPPIQTTHTEKSIDQLIQEVKDSADKVIDSLYEEFYLQFQQDIEETNDAANKALNHIKNQLKFTPTTLGTSKKLPDSIYQAIAEAILDAMGASKVEKYADNVNEFNKQLYAMLKGGSLNKNYITKIDGVTYTINLQGFLYGGVGFSGTSVKWKDKNNKQHSGYVYWSSSPSEALAAISEYCLAINKINTKAWTEAASYFLTGTPDSKIVSMGSKIVEALCDTKAGNALANTIGTEFKKEFKSGFFGLGNTFKEFVKQFPGGEKIVKIAESISKISNVTEKTISKISQISNLKNNIESFSNDTNDIVNLVNLLNSEYEFYTSELNNFTQKVTELENKINQQKTEKLNDLPEYKRPTVDEIFEELNKKQ